MGSRDQEEFEREYQEKQFQNRGGNNKFQRMDNQPKGYGGQQPIYNRRQGTCKVVWEQIKMPHLNTSIEKIWEVVILMEDILEPHNVGDEPPPGRRSRELCAYHRFHGHTTNNCRNVKKIILRMIDQEKLNHFLVQQPQNIPPSPSEGHTQASEKGRNTYLIEYRVHARDTDGREILNLAKVSPLKDWQKQPISLNAKEVPVGGEPHECPLVVKFGINPKVKDNEDEEDDANTWDINRILIDPGSSVDILFYHTYNTMGGRDEELIPSTYKIYGFNGSTNKPKGDITMRIPLKSVSSEIIFCVVDVESPYNALIGRPWLHSLLAVASTFHQCTKFPMPQGIGIIKGDPIESKTCQEIDVDKCEERASKRRN
ncbi:uncharacterized protein LOC113332444 [Papaver somniferum]|uniref:uncharacterized protein LOC113332444 n=1 Tax=Papaver somniferum TaxID=3469 RepID=UPI000E6F968D|nr:uncharacterized protein LOC113332444 [Papaver somniferum]